MKYADLINFSPIDSVVQLTAANDKEKAVNLVKSYVMSDDMAEKLEKNMLSQLRLDEVVDNKGVLVVGNYGTGKSHLMSVISSIAHDEENLKHVQNKRFADVAHVISGQFEVLRVEIGAVTMSLRNILLTKIQQDFAKRGLDFTFPDESEVTGNKEVLLDMMELFASKYPGKGYLIVVDELLDYLGGRKEQEVKLDLGFMRELGEIIKSSRLRAVFGLQEKLFDNPNFSFVSETLNRVKDRYEQVIIRKEDTAYVVSERILKKNAEQKALVRKHLEQFSSLYTNMVERMEEYVELYPIHPSYIDVFNKIYIIENRHILKNISEIIRRILNNEITDEAPGIISFDSYWSFIKENYAYRTDANIKEVVVKSGMLEDIVSRSFPKKLYKSLAIQIIHALSVHRLTTVDISIRSGLTAENLRDDLTLYLDGMPEQDSDFLQSIVQTVLKDVMTTVSGQFIEHNHENGQYYLDLDKDIDYDEKITQKAAVLDDVTLNRFYYDVVYYCMDWDQKEKVTNFKIYEHTLNWASHSIFRRGYLFMGTPESRPTAEPPEDYYIYFLPPYGNESYKDEKKEDEVFFSFKPNDDFKNDLKLYAAALLMKELAEEKNKGAYQNKAANFKKKLMKYLSDNKTTCFEITYKGERKQAIEVLKAHYKKNDPFKETMDLISSICFDEYFNRKYPEMPIFKTPITMRNRADVIRTGIDRFAGRKNIQANALLESFGLIENDTISVKNSKYANCFIKKLSQLPPKGVVNFNEIYEERFDDWVDNHFRISYEYLHLVFLALVHTGNAVITLKNGTTINASNLDTLVKVDRFALYEFRHISKPKEVALAELVRLFEVLDIPVGLINNPNKREDGLEKLIAKANEITKDAVTAGSKLSNDFELWGEPMVATHISSDYKDSVQRLVDEFANFQSKYNTVAKLNNFNLSMDKIDQIEKDIKVIGHINGLAAFKNNAVTDIGYIMNLERLELGADFASKIERSKDQFRKVRDEIAYNMNGMSAAQEINRVLASLKAEYIDIYFSEHRKKRLDVAEGKKKGELVSSVSLSNLKKLKSIEILSGTKLDMIERDLASLKICYELTPELLKHTHICPKCNYVMNDTEMSVKGKLEEIEDRIELLTSEWTNSLYNTLSDPLVISQESFMNSEQQNCIDQFLEDKTLPEVVDNFFVSAVSELLQGFDPVVISTDEFIQKLDEIGPCDVSTFKARIDELIKQYTQGKDKDKLRIVVKR